MNSDTFFVAFKVIKKLLIEKLEQIEKDLIDDIGNSAKDSSNEPSGCMAMLLESNLSASGENTPENLKIPVSFNMVLFLRNYFTYFNFISRFPNFMRNITIQFLMCQC